MKGKQDTAAQGISEAVISIGFKNLISVMNATTKLICDSNESFPPNTKIVMSANIGVISLSLETLVADIKNEKAKMRRIDE